MLKNWRTVMPIDLHEHLAFYKMLLRWSLLGGLVGIAAGTASAVFLVSLEWATNFRVAHPEILVFLPLAGFGIGYVYYQFGGSAARGNNLVIEEASLNQSRIPRRMTPLVLVSTVMTHLFGGSAGREGVAVQMGASLADAIQRLLNLSRDDRRLMILAGISGGFASIFGTPVAGFVFGLEVQKVGRIRYDGVMPCLVAALVGDITTRALGVGHTHYPHLPDTAIDPVLVAKVLIAAIVFGLTALLFIELTHLVKHQMQHRIAWKPLHPVIGGSAVIAMTLLVGSQDYLGLSLPLIRQSLDGTGVAAGAFLLKLIFTSVTLGAGFTGGEVTPLFVIGSTLGYTLAQPLGVDPVFLAAVGFVAVFAACGNTPLACTIMGAELFGSGILLYLAAGCFIAYLASGHRGIYITQPVSTPKIAGADVENGESLETLAKRRAVPPP